MSPERALEGWLLLQEAYPERFLIMILNSNVKRDLLAESWSAQGHR